ncbi:FMN-dependent NADH-azoreductase [Paenibacillus sacheonensis]|uniref:FMN dependent NADH:quinone oxidoreductase n=1 Tax=Paenibacillus sacheonensis TaxID=742054 RepID=A0A7X5BZR7_9BACL|nr:FMN-dependent NADH-azoreductase [Paenibacillus sacheonensis]MBM7563992.1 FMN-dependent NADH-azoreductase [Paenibacillus sacheonensis]NBC67669.1 FMN-dependent NADH-azoreductase [Paenibacillus sacheonensis]
MKQLLYITATPKSPEHSVGLQVGGAFLKAYREAHPDDYVRVFDVNQEAFQTVDGDVVRAWEKLRKEHLEFSELSPAEQRKVNALNDMTEMAMRADKYVFVSPMWNWGIPPRLKAFIDAFVIVGKTFHYTERGPVGLLRDKKALHIQTSGGIYSTGPAAAMDHSHPYLRQVLGIVGIEDVQALYVEGHDFQPERSKEIVRAAKEQAVKLAAAW